MSRVRVAVELARAVDQLRVLAEAGRATTADADRIAVLAAQFDGRPPPRDMWRSNRTVTAGRVARFVRTGVWR